MLVFAGRLLRRRVLIVRTLYCKLTIVSFHLSMVILAYSMQRAIRQVWLVVSFSYSMQQAYY